MHRNPCYDVVFWFCLIRKSWTENKCIKRLVFVFGTWLWSGSPRKAHKKFYNSVCIEFLGWTSYFDVVFWRLIRIISIGNGNDASAPGIMWSEWRMTTIHVVVICVAVWPAGNIFLNLIFKRNVWEGQNKSVIWIAMS